MIPFFENGTFRNFQMRKDNPKTLKSYYRGVGALLYNSDILKLTNKIYFVEGPVDALIMIQNGIPAISTNAGEAFKPEWMDKFIYQDEIYICFDNDTAGITGARRVSKVLGLNRCKCYCFQDFDEKGYDPVDYFRDGGKKDDLLNIIETKSKYGFEI
jgi:DNA primase